MEHPFPTLDIHGPNGETFTFALTEERITIGRFRDFNDVGLEPDPQQLVTRKAHCIVEREAQGWWVVDNGSINKTFVRRAYGVEIVEGRAPLEHGDVIQILGRLPEKGEPLYWELTFLDPLKTHPAEGRSSAVYLEYNWIQAKLFRIEGSQRVEIEDLRPQEHKLIRYMDQRNRANGNVPVMCLYDELIEATWGDEFGHTEAEINQLVWRLRQKIELDPAQPCFLQTVRGLGYRLETRPSSSNNR